MSWQPRLLPPLRPTLAGYVTFLQGIGIPPYILGAVSNLVTDNAGADVLDNLGAQITSNPAISFIVMTLQIALDLVNDQLCMASPDIYTLCVYNLAADRLINFGQDTPGQTYFADQRKLYRIDAFSPGIVTSTSDQSTASSYLNPDFMKNLTFLDLQTMKTPYGRTYMGYAQSVGTLWGLS